MERRKLLTTGATAFGLMIAGCTSTEDDSGPSPTTDDSNGDGTGNGDDQGDESNGGNGNGDGDDGGENDEVEPEDVEEVIGALIDGDQMQLVVEDIRYDTQLSEFLEADPGNEFVIVSVAMKNISDEFLGVSNLLQASVVDDEDYSYNMTYGGTDEPTFNDGQFAPGEVERGTVVFEVPEDATGLELRFDFDVSIFGGIDRAYINLEDETDVHILEQDLQIEVYDVGQAIEYEGTEIVINSVEYEQSLDQFTEADPGNEYVIVDLSVTNETGEEQRISTALQMLIKDENGFSYQEDWGAGAALSQNFDETSPLEDGETRRGQVAYQVEEDLSPLYWVFEFDMWIDGDKTFWQLR
ncbi:DUF4352 domain-containing protein [Natronosalvus amylolyticus]|uniref:DUF4352 domain-containing protein n=1 Tax=Natronosalvus amylolyticus TaxID=2961994 RepID=UPI0020CA08A8|nr:DUF4352 domain-containing protein [Natronosalvus amylolyticus]